MRSRYIQSDVREDIMIAGIIRLQHLKYILPALFIGISIFFVKVSLAIQLTWFILCTMIPTFYFLAKLDLVLARQKKYRKITNLIPEQLLSDLIRPKEGDVVISYESGARAVLLRVESISRRLIGDDKYDQDIDTWGNVCAKLHEEGIVFEEITDWMVPETIYELDVKEQEYYERYGDDPERLEKALRKIKYYKSLKIPVCQYHLKLITFNNKTNLLSLVQEITDEAKKAGLHMELLSAEMAYDFANKQINPFGERSSIEEKIQEESKLIQLINVWFSTRKASAENRLYKKRQLKKLKER